jgi:hypothetical protein
VSAGPLLLDHYFRGFDHHGNLVAGLEVHLFHAAAGNDTLDLDVADLHHEVRHHAVQMHLFDAAAELITGR